MAIFPGTPKWGSPEIVPKSSRLESRNFGSSYLPIAESDRDKVYSKVVALVAIFSTPCCTLKSDVEKRSIPDF
jgi:hypothetical protein